MIKTFKHSGLENFFHTGSKKGIQPDHAKKLGRILDRLDVIKFATDMNLPGFDLHELKGNEKGTWSVSVNGNWRVTFQFINDDVYVADYRDSH